MGIAESILSDSRRAQRILQDSYSLLAAPCSFLFYSVTLLDISRSSRQYAGTRNQGTGPMKFGYYILNTYVPKLDGKSPELYAHWLEQIDAAENLGFDSFWATEHHFRYFGGMLPNPQMLLAAAAQRTKRMRIGPAVTILPMHHPVRIAEDFAMVDLLSNGRLNFGAGRGMHPLEYTVFGADFKTAQLRLPEALDIVVRAWTDDAFEWNGKDYRYPKLAVYPKPLQKPHPPIYITANRDPESFQMIGQRGYHLMTLPWVATNEVHATRVELYLED